MRKSQGDNSELCCEYSKTFLSTCSFNGKIIIDWHIGVVRNALLMLKLLLILFLNLGNSDCFSSSVTSHFSQIVDVPTSYAEVWFPVHGDNSKSHNLHQVCVQMLVLLLIPFFVLKFWVSWSVSCRGINWSWWSRRSKKWPVLMLINNIGDSLIRLFACKAVCYYLTFPSNAATRAGPWRAKSVVDSHSGIFQYVLWV